MKLTPGQFDIFEWYVHIRVDLIARKVGPNKFSFAKGNEWNGKVKKARHFLGRQARNEKFEILSGDKLKMKMFEFFFEVN